MRVVGALVVNFVMGGLGDDRVAGWGCALVGGWDCSWGLLRGGGLSVKFSTGLQGCGGNFVGLGLVVLSGNFFVRCVWCRG